MLGWLFGQLQQDPVRYEYGIPGMLAALAIVLLFGLGLAGFNVCVALRTKKGDERKVYLIESSPKDQLQPRLQSYDYLKPGDRVCMEPGIPDPNFLPFPRSPA